MHLQFNVDEQERISTFFSTRGCKKKQSNTGRHVGIENKLFDLCVGESFFGENLITSKNIPWYQVCLVCVFFFVFLLDFFVPRY